MADALGMVCASWKNLVVYIVVQAPRIHANPANLTKDAARNSCHTITIMGSSVNTFVGTRTFFWTIQTELLPIQSWHGALHCGFG